MCVVCVVCSLRVCVCVCVCQLDSGERERRLEVALLMSNIKLAREQVGYTHIAHIAHTHTHTESIGFVT